ncbi:MULTISPECIES: 50S ribosomal protein L37e [Methanohalobium]|jgi:large subunit ribosomal protein L37e|uniref:Large ribosomal subunit protein eL37 n=1 Tax=Methanohalobium evestigatum (strain ATCC BAA-1072 / DSM 3721 / NBRC 107634 / OCM 161 / Z-7303) TaxID=644295 RepID=D7E693_METEZ|nr:MULTISPECIES: 50S ribosomal protein L37e [Methanohalobium]ADI73115.1 Ribosomal protein L37e [Methanohalobium evestigatum Z-7303]
MSKGTESFGKRQKRTHTKCRRCGSMSFNVRDKECKSCGFGKTKRMRSYNWNKN